MVVGDERPQHRLAGVLVVPDGSGEGEHTLPDPGDHPGGRAPTMAFEVELSLEGLVHRLDYLAERLQELTTGTLGLPGHGGADEGDAHLCQQFFELGGAVALVGHEDLAAQARGQGGVGQKKVPEDIALVFFRAGEGKGYRQAARGGDEVVEVFIYFCGTQRAA